MTSFLAFAAFIQGACAAADLFLLRRDKTRLQLYLIALWDRLDDVSLPELPALAAGHVANLFAFVTGPRLRSVRALAGVVLWSAFLTVLTFVVYGLLLLGPDNLQNLWRTGPWRPAALRLLVVNAVTAAPSFLLTYWTASTVRGSTPTVAVARLLGAAGASILLALLNYQLGLLALGLDALSGLTLARFFSPLAYYNYIITLRFDVDVAIQIAISTSSFFLNIMILFSIGALSLLKAALATIRWTLLRLFEAASERPAESLAPFSGFGLFLNALVLFVRLGASIFAPRT